MKAIDLCGKWWMKSIDESEWIEAKVPGSVYQDLLSAEKVPDPYYRDNEEKIGPVYRKDYEYKRDFTVGDGLLRHDRVELHCMGLDTLATLSINGRFLADTNNMHRTWRFDIKGFLQKGSNEIKIVFHSPAVWKEKMAERYKGQYMTCGNGVEYIRKAQCMFGWDWGINLPDFGIWREISIHCCDVAKIEDVQILQKHQQGEVRLDILTECSLLQNRAVKVSVAVKTPDGEILCASGLTDAGGKSILNLRIAKPRLWWPNGFGEQPLYHVDVALSEQGRTLDGRQLRIGLRTIKLKRETDRWGESYAFIVNGRPIFLKGANLVIEDALLGRTSRSRTDKMISDCLAANFNCIRVWGGSVYPDDYFFDLCDQYGILVYHDLMFACNFYPTDPEFLDNIEHEIRDNVFRIKNHACLCLWSGNNEVDLMYDLLVNKASESAARATWKNVLKLFYEYMPKLMAKLDPQTDFVCTSPVYFSVLRSNFDKCDAHYYIANENMAPYTNLGDMHFRFMSEMGFQSYPDIKTIYSFTEEEDRKPISPMMQKHQKRENGNETIRTYMERDYKVPVKFESYVYISQILAGEIMRYSVENLRQDEGRCMGVLVWQLNDCWPVISWAGIDYYGRWKAQQYYMKRAFAPILMSAKVKDASAELLIVNDRPEGVVGTVGWRLLDSRSKPVRQGTKTVLAPSCVPFITDKLDFSDILQGDGRKNHYLEFTFAMDGKIISEGVFLFVKPKDFNFVRPEIRADIREEQDRFVIRIQSDAFAKSVSLAFSKADCIFSDNYFDLSAGRVKEVVVAKKDLSGKFRLEELEQQLEIFSLYDAV